MTNNQKEIVATARQLAKTFEAFAANVEAGDWKPEDAKKLLASIASISDTIKSAAETPPSE